MENLMRKLERIAKTVKYRLERRYRPAIQHKCHVDFVGSDYCGYGICPTALSSEPTVYSFGIGEDVSFDLGMIERYHARVYAFDPTSKSIAWVKAQSLPAGFQWFDYGIGHRDGEATFYPPENTAHVSYSVLQKQEVQGMGVTLPVKRLNTITHTLGHATIDVLKMDIEASEYDVIPDILNSPEIRIKQILVEFHHRFPEVGVEMTQKAIDQLNKHGFRLFWVSANGENYAFIHVS